MLYRQRIEHCRLPLEALLAALTPAFASLKNGTDAAAPLLAVASRTDDLDAMLAVAAEIKKRFTHIVIAGAGGSGLSGRTLAALNPGPQSSQLSFLENIDPDAIDAVLSRAELQKTHFIVISKSGTTAETLAQFYAFLAIAKTKLGSNISAHFTVITGTNPNPLRASAAEYNMRILDHASDIGGRFSILTIVGLLPAALAGIDITALRKGAASVADALSQSKSAGDFAPAVGASLHMAHMRERPISVFLPYSERLSGLASWWRQCWAESLGKNGKGSTPIRAVGTTDQHSQLQLYLDGPQDKFFHLVTLSRAGTGQSIAAPDLPELAYLQGKTTGDIMAAEQKATLETLVAHRSPVRVFELDTLKEEQMGALIMHLMLEVIFTAALLGVNAFDQPAVEEGKRLARDYLLTGKV